MFGGAAEAGGLGAGFRQGMYGPEDTLEHMGVTICSLTTDLLLTLVEPPRLVKLVITLIMNSRKTQATPVVVALTRLRL